jgi:hypothetical protein
LNVEAKGTYEPSYYCCTVINTGISLNPFIPKAADRYISNLPSLTKPFYDIIYVKYAEDISKANRYIAFSIQNFLTSNFLSDL